MFFAATILLIISIISSPAFAANRVDVIATTEDGYPVDTLDNGGLLSFQIWIENDIVLGAIGLGFKVWSPDGANLIWNARCHDWNYNPSFACPVPGSRADDPNIFDMTGLLLTGQDIDGILPDTFGVGGVALVNGLPTGPLEPLYAAYFTPMVSGDGVRTVCIDSVFIPPSGAFVFVDLDGNAWSPTVLWPYGGRCWPTSDSHFHCWAEWDEELPTEMTVSYCGSNSVTLSASHPSMPVDFYLYQQIGGNGEATVTDNGDGTCEVGYAAAPGDMGQNITLEIDANCDQCPASTSLYSLSVNVISHPPALDSGFYYKWGATENPVTKDDIGVDDADGCEEHEFFMVSGPGEIDPISGVYYWLPGPVDTGGFIIEVGVTDGNTSSTGSFQVGITDQACCPGDVNRTGAVNVGDAVSLINYIFKGGHTPDVMNWADPNADCQVNVGDVVYLINYVFRSGPAPLLGCVY
jgi:hypothetical protein